jgi:Spy/CpxP family protein refolding chaperone
MKRKLLAVAAGLLAASALSYAQPMGPGMMGPGMMGPGMMGPGMMGPGMMGPGMMGPGMMGGYGMGPGMMGGFGPAFLYGLDLTDEQQEKIAEVQQELDGMHWDLMGRMHRQGGPMGRAFGPGPLDEKAARKAYDEMAAAQKQMFEASLQARKRIDAILTPEQREQLRRGPRGRAPGR